MIRGMEVYKTNLDEDDGLFNLGILLLEIPKF